MVSIKNYFRTLQQMFYNLRIEHCRMVLSHLHDNDAITFAASPTQVMLLAFRVSSKLSATFLSLLAAGAEGCCKKNHVLNNILYHIMLHHFFLCISRFTIISKFFLSKMLYIYLPLSYNSLHTFTMGKDRDIFE